MDYQNLKKEYSSWSSYTKQNYHIISKFHIFWKTLVKQGDSFYSKTKKSLDDFSNEISKQQFFNTSLNATLQIFSTEYSIYLQKWNNSLKLIDKQINESLVLTLNKINHKNTEALTSLDKLTATLQDNKNKLEKIKNNYFDASKDAFEHEKSFLKMVETKGKQDDVAHSHEVWIKLRNIADNNFQIYKREVDCINSLIEQNEKKYTSVISSFHSNEEQNWNELSQWYTQLLQVWNCDVKSFDNCYQTLVKNSKLILVKKDINILKEYFNYNIISTNNTNTLLKSRFEREQMINYEIYRRNKEMSEQNPTANSQICNITWESIIKEDDSGKFYSDYQNNIWNSLPDEEETPFTPSEKTKSFIDRILNDAKQVEGEEITDWINDWENNITWTKEFIHYLKSFYQQNMFVKIFCIENLHHLANILIIISNNIQGYNELFDINFVIIYIAEKTIYFNETNIFNRCYLCKILSKNKWYASKDFWLRLIDIKIGWVIEKEIQTELEKREQTAGKNNPQNSVDKSDANSNVWNKMKNLFTVNKAKTSKKMEKNIIYNQLYQQKQTGIAVAIVDDYIQHFMNFNHEISECIDIISDWAVKYKFDNVYVTYFITKWNSNWFTIKNQGVFYDKKDLDDNAIANEGETRGNKPNYFKSSFYKYTSFNDHTLTIIAYSLKYLPWRDMPNILSINKTYNMKLRRMIYKNIWLKNDNLSLSTRFNIWKNVLNYFEIKRKYRYPEIIAQINSTENLQLHSRDIIELDVQRTPFTSNQAENRAKILNILRAIAKELPNINYCQGMNYIAAFIWNIVNDEEEAFYLFLSWLWSTDYGLWFINDWEKLKTYFYVFNRLLNIWMPEWFFYLKSNNIAISFFVSPWFITLFTNSYQYVTEGRDNPLILLRIWDMFLIHGWKAIWKIGLSLLKHYENQLWDFRFEDLLHFLINDITKFGFFQNANWDKLTFIIHNFQIKGGLISNIESEYEWKKKIDQVNKNDYNNNK